MREVGILLISYLPEIAEGNIKKYRIHLQVILKKSYPKLFAGLLRYTTINL